MKKIHPEDMLLLLNKRHYNIIVESSKRLNLKPEELMFYLLSSSIDAIDEIRLEDAGLR